jgi:hypothetical protein
VTAPPPQLIGAVEVEVQPANRAATPYDRDAREPLRTVRAGATVAIKAQVYYDTRTEPDMPEVGAAEVVQGHLTVRVKDLADKGWTPKRGDRLVKVAGVACNLYVTQDQPGGHWSADGPSLRRVHFTDRRPSAQAPTM